MSTPPTATNGITLPTLNLADAERLMCIKALALAGSICEAATLLGCTRHALKRRIVKHRIEWPRFEVRHIEGSPC